MFNNFLKIIIYLVSKLHSPAMLEKINFTLSPNEILSKYHISPWNRKQNLVPNANSTSLSLAYFALVLHTKEIIKNKCVQLFDTFCDVSIDSMTKL